MITKIQTSAKTRIFPTLKPVQSAQGKKGAERDEHGLIMMIKISENGSIKNEKEKVIENEIEKDIKKEIENEIR